MQHQQKFQKITFAIHYIYEGQSQKANVYLWHPDQSITPQGLVKIEPQKFSIPIPKAMLNLEEQELSMYVMQETAKLCNYDNFEFTYVLEGTLVTDQHTQQKHIIKQTQIVTVEQLI